MWSITVYKVKNRLQQLVLKDAGHGCSLSFQIPSLWMWDLLFLRFTLPLDAGTPNDSRRKGRGRTESELVGGFMLEPLKVRCAAPLTRGGEWMAVGEELHQISKTSVRGKMPKCKLALWPLQKVVSAVAFHMTEWWQQADLPFCNRDD